MKKIKITFAGTLASITKKTSLDFNGGDDVKTILDALKKIDKTYNNKILTEINNKFMIIYTKDKERPKLIATNQIGEIELGINNEIKFFYRFTGG